MFGIPKPCVVRYVVLLGTLCWQDLSDAELWHAPGTIPTRRADVLHVPRQLWVKWVLSCTCTIIWSHAYDEHILRATNPDLLKSISLAVRPHAGVVSSLWNSCWFVFIFRSGKSLVLTNNAACVTSKTRNWLDTAWAQLKFKVSWKFSRL